MDHEIPDRPPLPEPGDLVLAAYKRYALTPREWAWFQDGLARWLTTWARLVERAKAGYGVAPYWRKTPAEQLRHEAKRLMELGQAEWRLFEAYARELELREEVSL